MIEQPQYTAAATGLSRSEWIRLMQCPKCHAYDGDPCVDARGAVTNLNNLADTLRQVQRERRLSEREVRSVRDTLKSLQTVRL